MDMRGNLWTQNKNKTATFCRQGRFGHSMSTKEMKRSGYHELIELSIWSIEGTGEFLYL